MSYIVMKLRNVCDKNCGYDKAKTLGIDTPCTVEDIVKAYNKSKRFSHHAHPTTLTHKVMQFNEVENGFRSNS